MLYLITNIWTLKQAGMADADLLTYLKRLLFAKVFFLAYFRGFGLFKYFLWTTSSEWQRRI